MSYNELSQYNGYTNFFTWSFNLHLDNNEAYCNGIIPEACKELDYNVNDVADRIADIFDEMKHDVLYGTCSPMHDIVNYAKAFINFREIAEYAIEYAREFNGDVAPEPTQPLKHQTLDLVLIEINRDDIGYASVTFLDKDLEPAESLAISQGSHIVINDHQDYMDLNSAVMIADVDTLQDPYKSADPISDKDVILKHFEDLEARGTSFLAWIPASYMDIVGTTMYCESCKTYQASSEFPTKEECFSCYTD